MANTKYSSDKNGIFSTLVWDGTYNEDGTKHRKQLRSKKSSRDLENKVNDFRNKINERKIVIDTDISFLNYAKQWFTVFKANREINTKSMYDNIINVHMLPLQDIKLSATSRIHLQTLLNNTTPATGRQIYITFKQIIKSAIVDRYLPPIALDDIFSTIECPKPVTKEKRVLTEAEKKAIRQGDFAPMDKAFLYLIYGCGLRREEALALSIFDIDFASSSLSINKALVFQNNDPHIKGTKTENGQRNLHMPPFLKDYLQEYVKTIHGTNLFHTKGKLHLTKSSYDKMWRRIQTEINRIVRKNKEQITSNLTAHIFRHNYCSALCYQVPIISIKKIATLMGDTQKVVLDVYDHIMLDKEDTPKAVEQAINL